jgi:hypothetical protein
MLTVGCAAPIPTQHYLAPRAQGGRHSASNAFEHVKLICELTNDLQVLPDGTIEYIVPIDFLVQCLDSKFWFAGQVPGRACPERDATWIDNSIVREVLSIATAI